MESSDKEVLLNILKHVNHAIKYTEKYDDIAAFEADDMCVEATVFNLMQIGELTKTSLSDELKNQIRAIPWKEIYGLRNRIVHGYEGVKLVLVWQTIKEDLPELKREILEYLNKNS